MKKRISILLVILWTLLIFVMSSFDSTNSSNQSGFIAEIISNIFNISNIDALRFIIRKMAHFTEYFILGLLMYNMINNFNKKYYIAIILCILCAMSDELYQSFIPGRSSKLLDILIDSIGSTFGVYLLHITSKFKKEKIKYLN